MVFVNTPSYVSCLKYTFIENCSVLTTICSQCIGCINNVPALTMYLSSNNTSS